VHRAPNPGCVVFQRGIDDDLAFPPDLCDLALALAVARREMPERYAGDNAATDGTDRRSVEHRGFTPSPAFEQIRDRLLMCLIAGNAWWELDFDVMTAAVVTYGVGDRYVTHIDLQPGTQALKLSCIVQLSGPNDYDGGALEFLVEPNVWVAPRERGTVVVFPAWMPHTVHPITRGRRRSLVVAMYGPPFR
jgi:predicted 2-oxoglutarate/Fe(II)-dependent dioxygenase YbiX